MMIPDGNWPLIMPGAPKQDEEEQYRYRYQCRCCCHAAHRRKARCCSLELVLLLVVLLLVVVLLLLVLLGALGWFDLTRNQKVGTSPDSTSPVFEAQKSAFQGGGGMKWPSAMLTAPLENNSNGRYLQWESNIGNAFCHGGFKYCDRALVVPTTGIYRVFLQLTYGGVNCSKPLIELRSSVLVHTDSYTKDLRLMSVSDIVKDSAGSWRKSLYSAGLYKLEAESQLLVNATHRGFLAKNEDEVFFGAELVQRLPDSKQ